MSKLRQKISIAVTAIIFMLPLSAYPQEGVRTVVFFCAWNANNPSFQYIIEGFKTTFSEDSGLTYNLLAEYLDVSRLDNKDYAQDIIDLYNEKYKNIPIDLIITIGPSFYQDLQTLGLKALGSTPVITIFNEQLTNDTLVNPLKENLLSINFNFDLGKTLQTAFELFPENKNVYLISGITSTDKYFAEIVKKDTVDFSDTHDFVFVTGISIDSTLRVVEQVPQNSITFVVNYQMDSNGTSFSTPEVIGMVADHSVAPVFMFWDAFRTKRGGIGGYVFSYINVGEEVGIAARNILNGMSMKDVSINQDGFYHYAYDWQELKKWGLSNSKAIPEDSIFYYYDRSFIEEYKWYALGLILFLLGETLLIMYLFRLNRRQKEITRKMIETDSIYRKLVREDRFAKMTELTASLSHELNQPLTAVLFNAQAGKRFLRSGKLDPVIAEQVLDNIIEDSKRAGGIIGSVRNLMKLDQKEKEIIDMDAVIRETVSIIRNDTITQGIKLNVEYSAGPAFVLADKVQLQQVLLNIIRNAEIAMEDNVPGKKRLDIISYTSRDSVTVRVRDSGPGINSAIIEKIFNPFVTTRKDGSGIGLALSRSIMEAHNGSIRAANLPDGGAEFSFSLHLVKNG